jgi:hypothetical protein
MDLSDFSKETSFRLFSSHYQFFVTDWSTNLAKCEYQTREEISDVKKCGWKWVRSLKVIPSKHATT